MRWQCCASTVLQKERSWHNSSATARSQVASEMRALALVAVSTLRAPRRLVVRHADDLPTVEEALASADACEGNAIVDPYMRTRTHCR